MRKKKTRLEGEAAGHCHPADDGRKGPCGAADNDVLRRPPLEPCRIDRDVKENCEGEQRRREPAHEQAEHSHREGGEHDAERKRLAGRDAALRNGTSRGAPHHRVDVCVIPHIEHARGTGADRDAQKRGESDDWMEMPRRNHDADQRGKDDERHDSRLHQRHIVADARDARPLVDRRRPISRELCTFAD